VTTALIAGQGGLPAALVAAMAIRPLIASLDGFSPDGLTPDLHFRIERLVPFLRALQDRGVSRVTFAGAAQRPRLEPALIDPLTAQLLPRLMAAMAQGDDATLREVIAIFEDEGFAVDGVHDIAPGLIPAPGFLAGGCGCGAGRGRAAGIMPCR
jgi:UDP-2,3-diacylglucosamine hydrolase